MLGGPTFHVEPLPDTGPVAGKSRRAGQVPRETRAISSAAERFPVATGAGPGFKSPIAHVDETQQETPQLCGEVASFAVSGVYDQDPMICVRPAGHAGSHGTYETYRRLNETRVSLIYWSVVEDPAIAFPGILDAEAWALAELREVGGIGPLPAPGLPGT